MIIAAMAPAATNLAADMNVGGEALRIVISLFAVLALIIGAGMISRRVQGRISGGKRLKVIECIGLGPKERVALVHADGKQLLIGIGQSGVRTLHVYDKEVPVEAEEVAKTQVSFKGLLARAQGKV